MPLVAFHLGKRLESPDFDAPSWTELKSTYRTDGLTMVCGQAGYPKTSPRGLQYFSHMPKTDCQLHEGGAETEHHLKAKQLIVEAARAVGWGATLEWPAPDRSWIADVLVEKDGRRIALEVQWSQQTDGDFRRRQDRYASGGVECAWFVHERNRPSAKSVPHYVIAGDAAAGFTITRQATIAGRKETISLSQAVQEHLTGTIQQRAELVATGLLVSVAKYRCWVDTCKRWYSHWMVSAVDVESRCGQTAVLSASTTYEWFATDRFEAHVQDRVGPLIRDSDLPNPVFYKPRQSKQAKARYMAANCPSCTATLGDFYFYNEPHRTTDYAVPLRRVVPLSPDSYELPHVCIDTGRGRCAQDAGLDGPRLFPTDVAWLEVDEGSVSEYGAPLPPRGSRRSR